jgi:hypothetical protein
MASGHRLRKRCSRNLFDGSAAVILRPSSPHADELIGTNWPEIDEVAAITFWRNSVLVHVRHCA